jgi:hypothetical protein
VRARSIGLWVLLAVVLVLVALVVASPSPRTDRPLDPSATGPRGARALVVLLDELGSTIEVGPRVDDDADTALLLHDRLSDAEERDLRSWIAGGGVLLLGDGLSPLAGAGTAAACPDGLLDGVDTLALGTGAAAEVQRGAGCYEGFVAATRLGDGLVVEVGSPRLFDNAHLGLGDNAAFAAGLLAPTGGEQVAFVHGSAGSGEQQLFDLLGPRTAQAIGQVAVAAVVFVLWRGRRLGRPVEEHQPVQVAGSELTAAVGRMLASRSRPAEAAAAVRAELRSALDRRLGFVPATPVEAVAAAVAERTGLDADAVGSALATRPVTSDDELVQVVAELDRIRDLTFHPTVHPIGRPTTGVPR